MFVVAFLIDFALRIFVNPRYAPSLIVGQRFVRRQQPEYVVTESAQPASVDPAEAERCKIPDFAKAMGHEEKWKPHNNCK